MLKSCCCRRYPEGFDCLDWLQFSNVNFLRVSFGDEHGDRLLGGKRDEIGTAFFKRMYYAINKGKHCTTFKLALVFNRLQPQLVRCAVPCCMLVCSPHVCVHPVQAQSLSGMLLAGVMVNGQEFAFLAYSSSQLKVTAGTGLNPDCTQLCDKHTLAPSDATACGMITACGHQPSLVFSAGILAVTSYCNSCNVCMLVRVLPV